MKIKMFYVLLFATILSCSKDDSMLKTNATIKNTGYACGLACDAITFSISVNDKEYWPVNLPQNFRVAGLPVLVSFKKTGKHPKQFEGPTDLEIIEITNIQKR